MKSLLDGVVELSAGDPSVLVQGTHTNVTGIEMRQKPGFRNWSLRDTVKADKELPGEFVELFPDILGQSYDAEARKWLLWDVKIQLGILGLHYVDWHNALLAPITVIEPDDIGLVFIEPALELGKSPAICDCQMSQGRMDLKLQQDGESKPIRILY